MRWALASLGEKERFDLVGIWINESWRDISDDLKDRLSYPKLEVLFSDGGLCIEENLLIPGMRHQRCIVYGKRDFPYLLYADGLKKMEQETFTKKLESILAMNLTQGELEKLTPEDLPRVKKLAEKTRSVTTFKYLY